MYKQVQVYATKLPILNPKYITTHIHHPEEQCINTSELVHSYESEYFHNFIFACKDVNHVFNTDKYMRKLVQVYITLIIHPSDILHGDGLERYAYERFVEFEMEPNLSSVEKIAILKQFDAELLKIVDKKIIALTRNFRLFEKAIYVCSTTLLAEFMVSNLLSNRFTPKTLEYIRNRRYLIKINTLNQLLRWFPDKFECLPNSNTLKAVSTRKR